MSGVEEKAPAAKPTASRWSRHLRVQGERWLAIRAFDLTPDEECFENPFAIRPEIGRWRRDPLRWNILLEMHREAYGVDAAMERLPARAHWLEQRIADAFEDEVLVLVRPMPGRTHGSSGGSADGDGGFGSGSGAGTATEEEDGESRDDNRKSPPPMPRKTWVEIKLLDQDGVPVPHERYRITLPDGTTKEGNLDEDGWMRESGLDPGDCVITFPDIHQEEWRPE